MGFSEGYLAYLASDHWQRFRRLALSAAGHRCARCDDDGRTTIDVFLEVHHLTYERLGRERLEDVEVLCTNCHMVEHGLSEEFTIVDGPEHISRILGRVLWRAERTARRGGSGVA